VNGPQLVWPAEDEVHVWKAALVVEPEALVMSEASLCAEERARAAAFRFARDREHFIAGRAWLRRLLARYLETDPGALSFESGSSGKPRLCWPDARGLRFNMSRSNSLAACAIVVNREVGVDVECVRDDFHFEPVVRRYFTDYERAALQALPSSERRREFFRYWTRKEACLKADGVGVRALPKVCELNCSIQSIDVGPEYAAAVATQGTPPFELATHSASDLV
jgi:4'-phosphopantetheinyl transferase